MSGRQPVPVLMYHDVDSDTAGGDPFTIPESELADHLDALVGAGWRTEKITALADKPATEGTVYLTFDDGLTSFARLVMPLLSQRQLSATLFVPTGHIGESAHWHRREAGSPEVMGWAQLRALDPDIVEVGSHGHSHRALDVMSGQRSSEEAVLSRRLLEEGLGRAVTSFAYPYGYHSRAVRAEAKQAGYRVACTVGYAFHQAGSDPFQVRRLRVGPGLSGPGVLRLLAEGQRNRGTMIAVRAARPAWRLLRRSRQGRGGIGSPRSQRELEHARRKW